MYSNNVACCYIQKHIFFEKINFLRNLDNAKREKRYPHLKTNEIVNYQLSGQK